MTYQVSEIPYLEFRMREQGRMRHNVALDVSSEKG